MSYLKLQLQKCICFTTMTFNISAKRDDQGESKVWPPPQAPDYMKTVKDLPSGVRVMHDRQTDESGMYGHKGYKKMLKKNSYCPTYIHGLTNLTVEHSMPFGRAPHFIHVKYPNCRVLSGKALESHYR